MRLIEQFLAANVKPTLGCTEPIAVALAAAYARSVVKGDIRKIEVLVDPNIFKNGMGAGIPKSKGKIGNIHAAALGAICGDPNRCLEVLDAVDDEATKKADELIKNNGVVIEVLRGRSGIFIDARVITSQGLGRARIEGSHTNLTVLERNGENALDEINKQDGSEGKATMFAGIKFSQLVDEAASITDEEVETILAAVAKNEAAAEYGLANECGLGVGLAFRKAVDEGLLGHDSANEAKILTAAAVDARMGGAPVGIMAVAGSGNQGIATTLPILAFCRHHGIADARKRAEATALAFLVTGYIKEHIGSLGALCGCVMAAASGSAAGIARLLGGDVSSCARAVTNVLADLAGVICDGAKGGCALKLATAANAAVQAAVLAKEGLRVTAQDGIIDNEIEHTVKNLGQLSNPGMTTTDEVILDIMTDKLKRGTYVC